MVHSYLVLRFYWCKIAASVVSYKLTRHQTIGGWGFAAIRYIVSIPNTFSSGFDFVIENVNVGKHKHSMCEVEMCIVEIYWVVGLWLRCCYDWNNFSGWFTWGMWINGLWFYVTLVGSWKQVFSIAWSGWLFGFFVRWELLTSYLVERAIFIGKSRSFYNKIGRVCSTNLVRFLGSLNMLWKEKP